MPNIGLKFPAYQSDVPDVERRILSRTHEISEPAGNPLVLPLQFILKVIVMNNEGHMKERTQHPGESFAHAEFMEKVFTNLRAFCDAEFQRLATDDKETSQPQPEKNMHPLYLA